MHTAVVILFSTNRFDCVHDDTYSTILSLFEKHALFIVLCKMINLDIKMYKHLEKTIFFQFKTENN